MVSRVLTIVSRRRARFLLPCTPGFENQAYFNYLDHCTALEVIKYAGKSDNNNARTKAAALRASRTKAADLRASRTKAADFRASRTRAGKPWRK